MILSSSISTLKVQEEEIKKLEKKKNCCWPPFSIKGAAGWVSRRLSTPCSVLQYFLVRALCRDLSLAARPQRYAPHEQVCRLRQMWNVSLLIYSQFILINLFILSFVYVVCLSMCVCVYSIQTSTRMEFVLIWPWRTHPASGIASTTRIGTKKFLFWNEKREKKNRFLGIRIVDYPAGSRP